jgi:hypothetical protein
MSGPQGIQGIQGIAGIQGIQGATGLQGVAGVGMFFKPTYYNVTTSSLAIPSASYGSLFNITTSGLTSITWPVVNWSGESNSYWILRNNSGGYLSITNTYTSVGATSLPQPMSIPPGTSVNVLVTSGSNYIMF